MHSPRAVKGTSTLPFRFTILRAVVFFNGRETIEETREMYPVSELERETSFLGISSTSGSDGTASLLVVSFGYLYHE